jgi:HAD superfamily hydrolase (TIGR01549 family)
VWPNWARISGALSAKGIHVDPRALADADPHVRRSLDVRKTIAETTDGQRALTFFEGLLTKAGVPLSDDACAALKVVEEYQRTMNLWEIVPDFVRPALAQLRRNGHKLVVVSNANGTLRRSFERLDLTRMVDVILDSSEEGFEKPDRRLFERALALAGASPGTTVHVGDLYHVDVLGARSAGLTGMLVDQADLYKDADCARVRSIADLPELVRST